MKLLAGINKGQASLSRRDNYSQVSFCLKTFVQISLRHLENSSTCMSLKELIARQKDLINLNIHILREADIMISI